MKRLVFILLLLNTIQAKLNVFMDRQLVEWVADLNIPRDSDGIFCSRVEAYVMTDEESYTNNSEIVDETDNDIRFNNVDNTFSNAKIKGQLIGFTKRQHPIFKSAFPIRVEVGRRYKVKWVTNSSSIPGYSSHDKYRMALVCVMPQFISSLTDDQDTIWDELGRRWIAVSDPFQIIAHESDEKANYPSTQVFDVTSLSFYGNEEYVKCPISLDRLKQPVRTSTNQVYDWEHLLRDINEREISGLNSGLDPHICPLTKQTYDFVWCDESLRARALKMTTDILNQLSSTNSWCFIEKEAEKFNLLTGRLNTQLGINPLGNRLWLNREIALDLEYKRLDGWHELFIINLKKIVDILGLLVYVTIFCITASMEINAARAKNTSMIVKIIGPLIYFGFLTSWMYLTIRNIEYFKPIADVKVRLKELQQQYERVVKAKHRPFDNLDINRNNLYDVPSPYGYPSNFGN